MPTPCFLMAEAEEMRPALLPGALLGVVPAQRQTP